jgi:hypothetical protein
MAIETINQRQETALESGRKSLAVIHCIWYYYTEYMTESKN